LVQNLSDALAVASVVALILDLCLDQGLEGGPVTAVSGHHVPDASNALGIVKLALDDGANLRDNLFELIRGKHGSLASLADGDKQREAGNAKHCHGNLERKPQRGTGCGD